VLYILWLMGTRAAIDVLDDGRCESMEHESSLLVGVTASVRRRRRRDIFAELERPDGLTIRTLAEPDEPYSIVIDASSELGTVRLCSDRAPTGAVVRVRVGADADSAGRLVWDRVDSTRLPESSTSSPTADVLNKIKAWRSMVQKPIPVEITDDCSRRAYVDTGIATPFAALAAASLLVAGCQCLASGDPLPNIPVELDLLGS
jgi:hypothetical protein